MKRICIAFSLLHMLFTASESHAEAFEFGFGLAFVDSTSLGAGDLGFDYQLGYEYIKTDNWNFGTQLHVINGFTSAEDISSSSTMAFDSRAIYMTARPENWILQFRAGLVSADYISATEINNPNGFPYLTTKSDSSIGFAYGAGIVASAFGNKDILFHIFDYNSYHIAGNDFSTYTISIAVVVELMNH